MTTVADRIVYLQCGLRMRSEVPLALPTAAADRWDVDVVWGPDVTSTLDTPPGQEIASLAEGDRRWYTATLVDDGYHVRFHTSGDFVISSALDRVEIRRDRSGRHDLLPILMAGTVSSIILALRGETVLHASAVEIGDGVVAFVGNSGRGKSTIAALMCSGGARLVTDDVLTVRCDDGGVSCIGGAHELRLRPSAASIAESTAGGSAASSASAAPETPVHRTTADDRLAFAPPSAPVARRDLVAIVIPVPSRTVDELVVESLEPSDALFTLLSFPRVYGWDHEDVLARDFAELAGVVNVVPVYVATIPWGPPFDPTVPEQLTAALFTA